MRFFFETFTYILLGCIFWSYGNAFRIFGHSLSGTFRYSSYSVQSHEVRVFCRHSSPTSFYAKKSQKRKKSRQKRIEADIGDQDANTGRKNSNKSGESFAEFNGDDDWDSDLEQINAEETTETGSDSEAMAKLKAEAAAPFRLFRTFIYGAVGAAGGLGTITNIPQLIFAFQDADGDKVNAVQNLAIDLAGVIGAAVLWSRERKAEQKQLESYTEKQRRQDNLLAPAVLETREQQLGMLPVEIQISEYDENATRIVSLSDLQLKGKQNVVIVSGEFEYVRDAVLSARLAGSDLFAAEETVVIPFVKNEQQQLDEGKEKGFGTQETLMTAPYIAKPQQLNVWQRILQNEVIQAEKEGGEDVWEQGIIIAIAKDGKVKRRGLGTPPWKELVEGFKNKKKKN